MDYYLSLPVGLRNTNAVQEKQLLRRAFKVCDPTLLPEQVLWRRKEAFSDGVSSVQRSWYQIIDERTGVPPSVALAVSPHYNDTGVTPSVALAVSPHYNDTGVTPSVALAVSPHSGQVHPRCNVDYGGINVPSTPEQVYYRSLYDSFYPDSAYIVPYFWMPNFVNAKDCSARTLDLY